MEITDLIPKYKLKKHLFPTLYRNELFLVITLVVVSFVLRFYGTDNLGFNNDESIYVAQAASLANFEEFREHFSIFRAHPLLMQFFVSLSLSLLGLSEISARLVPVLMGTGIVFLTYLIARLIYSKPIAIISSIILTFLPYHIIISRQVIVDVSFAFFLLLNILLLVIYIKSNSNKTLLLFLIGSCSGLSFLSKEIGIVVLITSVITIGLTKKHFTKNITLVLATFLAVTTPYWISFLFLENAQQSIIEYFNWQSSRPANHENIYYFELMLKEILGYPLCILVIIFYLQFILHRKIWNSLTTLIPFIWIPILFLFYQVLPIKNFAFLYSIVPLFVMIGISALFSSPINRIRFNRILPFVLIPVILISNTFFLNNFVFSLPYHPTLGSESVNYMKDASLWIEENTPTNSTALTLYTHMSNIIKFYSNRDSISLQSNNNPSYDKIADADFLIASKNINYLVYEKVQLDNANFLKNEAKKMEEYINKFNAIPIHTTYSSYTSSNGKNLSTPAIIIYKIN